MNPTVTARGQPLKRMITITRKIKRCPKCGSTDVNTIAGMMTGYKYQCRDCDYIGVLIIEEDVEKIDE